MLTLLRRRHLTAIRSTQHQHLILQFYWYWPPKMNSRGRTAKRYVSVDSSGRENEYPNKHAKRKDGRSVRRPLKPTTRGNIQWPTTRGRVQKPRADEGKDTKRGFKFILPKPLPGALPCRHQKNETTASADVLDNPSSIAAAIPDMESLWCPPIRKGPSAAEPKDGPSSAEGEDAGFDGN